MEQENQLVIGYLRREHLLLLRLAEVHAASVRASLAVQECPPC
jgi:hypothetical protein